MAVDAQFRRAKIKSPAYLWLAHAGSNQTKDLRIVVFNILLRVKTGHLYLCSVSGCRYLRTFPAISLVNECFLSSNALRPNLCLVLENAI